MAERIVNLNEKPRAVVTLQLGGRSFRIARVVNAVRKLYGEFLEQAGELVQKAARVEGLQAVSGEAEQARALATIQQTTEEVEAFAAGKQEILLKCIELLLVKNDLPFDRQWWLDNGDETDYQAFIVEALMKDAPQKKTAAAGA